MSLRKFVVVESTGAVLQDHGVGSRLVSTSVADQIVVEVEVADNVSVDQLQYVAGEMLISEPVYELEPEE